MALSDTCSHDLSNHTTCLTWWGRSSNISILPEVQTKKTIYLKYTYIHTYYLDERHTHIYHAYVCQTLHISAHAALHAYACAAHSTNLLEINSYSLGLLTKPYRFEAKPWIRWGQCQLACQLASMKHPQDAEYTGRMFGRFWKVKEIQNTHTDTHVIGELQRRVWLVTASKWQCVRNSMHYCAIILRKSRTTTAWVPRSII